MAEPALKEDELKAQLPVESGDADEVVSDELVAEITAAIEAGDQALVRALVDDLHPADLAKVVGLLHEEDRDKLIDFVEGLSAETLAELDPGIVGEIVEAMPAEDVAEAVAELDTDDAAFLLEDLDEERQAEILAEMPADDRLAVRQALDFEEETAGRLMQREVFAAPGYWTVGQIIDRLRGSIDLPDRFYEVFVVDPTNAPVGAVPLSTLLKSQRDIRIDAIMSDDIRPVPVTMDQEDVAYLFEQYNLISAPVVDAAGRLAGMITVDDVVEIVHLETNEDMLALAGVESDAAITDSVIETARSRFSWLAINLATAVLASLVISMFEAAIEEVVALAVLMPIVASMGGNAGTQTLAVAVRSLATKSLTAANAARIVWRETLAGGLNGLLFAVVMGCLATAWHAGMGAERGQAIGLGLVVGAAMVINLVAAGLAGILVPIGLQRAGADPAVSSAVFVTTVTDIVGFFVFLGLAAMVLL